MRSVSLSLGLSEASEACAVFYFTDSLFHFVRVKACLSLLSAAAAAAAPATPAAFRSYTALLNLFSPMKTSVGPTSTRAAQVKQPLPIPSHMAQSYDIIKQALIELQLSVQDEIPKFQRHVVSDSTIAVAL